MSEAVWNLTRLVNIPARGKGLSILIYAQHLSGIGHFVRAFEIARALSSDHRVYLVDGGRSFPHAGADIELVDIPRIARSESGLVSLDACAELASVLQQRQQAIRRFCDSQPIDVALIEHFPFSKWELEKEIRGLLEGLKVSNPRLCSICSIRDIVLPTAHEQSGDDTYARYVLERLHSHFDALLLHGDESLTPLSRYFAAARRIRIPLHYTGIVSGKAAESQAARAEITRYTGGKPFVLVSVGGGRDKMDLRGKVVHASRHLRADPDFSNLLWVICANALEPVDENFRQESNVIPLPFSAHFLSWLKRARLSVSCGGYNTCANLLETQTPALIVPNPYMSDQLERGQIMASLQRVVCGTPAGPEDLAELIRRAFDFQPLAHSVAIDGAERSKQIIEELATAKGFPTVGRRQA